MGSFEITNGFRERLEQELSSLESKLKNVNNQNKPKKKLNRLQEWSEKTFGFH